MTTRLIHVTAPCVPYPEEVACKTVGLGPCPDCRCDLCWLHYLRWEVKTGITLNAAQHHLVSSVVVDPALVEPARKPGTTPRMYFRVHDGDECVRYTVVATDRPHAEQLLRDSGNEWYDDSGNVVDFDKADLSWSEITPERAAEIKVFEDDGSKGPYPLNTFEPGDWFCSEY